MREGPDDFEEFDIGDVGEMLPTADCDGAVKSEDRGNQEYAWWYLVNSSAQDATVTIRRIWQYQGETRSDTRQHILFPGEESEVFSFPRNQLPRIAFVTCRLA